MASVNAPRDRLDYNSAIGGRASKIVARVMPAKPVVHRFYDPAGFVAASRYSDARNVLRRALIARIAAKATPIPVSPVSGTQA
jgi:hypothetical protein